MRIGIDARNDRTGIGRYTFSLVRELARLDAETEYVLFLRPERHATFEPPGANFRVVEADIPWFTAREQLLLPRLVRRERLDLVHYTHVNVPLAARTPFVATVHDLNYLDPAATPSEGTLSAHLRQETLRSGYRLELLKLRQARRIIAVSQHTRARVVDVLGVPSQRVEVVYNAADAPDATSADPAVLERHRLDKPFFLYVGAAYPYKNLARLIEAFALFLERGGSEFRLVLAGDHERFDSRLRQLAAELGLREQVVFPGPVTDGELAALYGAALGYAFVSLAEGFGLPGLEAMRASVPVVAARTGSLPEVYGNAARYCDPLDVESIAAALMEIASNEQLRTRLAALGRERAAEFSWSRAAGQTLWIYQNALAHGRE